jgi:hypothetical protein
MKDFDFRDLRTVRQDKPADPDLSATMRWLVRELVEIVTEERRTKKESRKAS